ncbi:MAG: glutamate-5-semialdehyde dehydrogenase [Chloroflexaceae bacterium]|nr:glutamate-5-semialdehyde dehydrogenase [Chloroflexaceae bacterium]
MSPTADLTALGKRARTAARALLRASHAQRVAALHTLADLLEQQHETILAANAEDLARGEAAGLPANLLDRMLLNPERLQAIAADTRIVAELPDPLDEQYDFAVLPSGLTRYRQRTPLGVVGMIYEARPNVTVDAAALCIKSGNAVVLRGGSDIRASCVAITTVIARALATAGLPTDAVQSITDPDRDLVRQMLRLDQSIDLIIPRGGASLHQFCRQNATIPVITGGIGVCHTYVDPTADLERAVPIIYNARVQRPSVCNSLDTLLVQRAIAAQFLPMVAQALGAAGVEFRADETARVLLQAHPDAAQWRITPAGAEDYDTEFLALILAIRVVDDLEQALAHIAQHGTGHSEAILTNDQAAAARFIAEVDASAVFVNTSTRFNDGGQFGLGAEIAVSTQKLQARGPMGLRELTSYKWVATGDWLVRS